MLNSGLHRRKSRPVIARTASARRPLPMSPLAFDRCHVRHTRWHPTRWVRPCPGLGRSGGIQWGVGRPAGGAFVFLLRVRGCAAGSLAHLLPGRASRIQLGVRGRGGGGAFIFLLRVRGAFFFCCGCALARAWASQAESNGAWAGQHGGAFIFLLRVRCAFFFLLWVRGRFAHSLAAGAGLGNPIRGLCGAGGGGGEGGGRDYFFAGGCAARFFFCCGCALARAWAGQAESNGAWAGQHGGAFIFLLRVRGAFFFFAVGARQVRSLTCCRGGPRESN